MKENKAMEQKVEPATTSAKSCPRVSSPVTLNEINQLAFRKWIAAGSPAGDCARFWMEAERELTEEPSCQPSTV
jgi:hypothetical protein